MESSKVKIRKTQEAIDKAFHCSPSVPNWCRMCKFLAEYIFIGAQLHDDYVYDSKPFRQAIGYLSLSPKRTPPGQILSDEEWVAMNYYNESERRVMMDAFGLLILRLSEWSVGLCGDEEEPAHSAPAIFAKKIWDFRMNYEDGKVQIFKAPLGRYVYRSQPLSYLGSIMKSKPILPNQDIAYLPQMEGVDDQPYEEESLKLQKRICHGVEMMVGDALSEGQARRRIGSDGEIAQENEALKRVRGNDGKGLRGFVAQVLRDPKWQFANGHPNTPAGRQRCYNRVYALMNPLRRAKSSS